MNNNPNIKNTAIAKGFALIATILVMSLLAVVSLGMISISSMEVKASGLKLLEQQAKANARMALMIALAEIQEKMGPDQRVCANADMLTTSGFAGWDRVESKKHLVAAYSTEKWAERDSSGLPGYWRKYSDTRNKNAFLGWLSSGKTDELNRLDFVKEEVDSGAELLLGEGTLGGLPEAEYVRVPKVNLKRDGSLTGRYAWVALDESVKANILSQDVRESDDDGYEKQISMMSAPSFGIDQVDGYDGFEKNGFENQLSRVLSGNQISLFGDGQVSKESVSQSMFDVTTYSQSVLSDPLRGGLKRDLSLPFELPSRKADNNASDWEYALNDSDRSDERQTHFNDFWEFSNSGDQLSEWRHSRMNQSGYRPYWWSKKMGYIYQYPGSGGTDAVGSREFLRGPSWDLLRSHYRMYKREFEGLAANHRDRRGVTAPTDGRTWLTQPYQPYSFRADSHGEHLLSHTYVGESSLFRGGYQASSVMNPLYRYGDAHSGNMRPWNNMSFTTYGTAPVLTKVGFVISVYTDQFSDHKRLSLCIDAVGTLWNPYNVAIETESYFTQMHFQGLKWSLERIRNGATEQWASEPGKSGYEADRAFPFKFLRLGVSASENGEDPNTNIRLMPGEVRTFGFSFPSPVAYSYGSLATKPGKFTNNWSGGYSLRHSDKWRLLDTDKLRFVLKPDDTKQTSLKYNLGYFENLVGDVYNPFDTDMSSNITTEVNLTDQPEISSVHIGKSSEMFDGNSFETTISDFPVGENNKKAIAYIELKRPASDSATYGMATEMDPRSIVNHIKAMGIDKGIPDNWEAKIKQVSDFDLLQNGVGDRNLGFYGSSHDGSGETHVVYYEVPDAPIVSLANFQSAQLSSTGWSPAYTVANSFPHPRLELDEVMKTEDLSGFENAYYDQSYLVNSVLFDRYFMSGLHLENDYDENTNDEALNEAEDIMGKFVDLAEKNPLANKRLELSANESDPEVLVKELTHYRRVARNLMLNGGFNVNSTRQQAWKAWLTSIRNLSMAAVKPEDGSVATVVETDAIFSRMAVVAGGEAEDWKGYSSLSDTEIDKLSTAIVEQVKIRGPFLSVGDFINRRIADDDTGKMGVIDAAIEAAFGNGKSGTGNEKGIPGKLRQGDILTGLGDVLVARSDTFIIRAYGEVVDNSGKVVARAWCEAVIQRGATLTGENGELLTMPNEQYKTGGDPGGLDAYVENDKLSPEATQFGRAFKVIKFRWLNEAEI